MLAQFLNVCPVRGCLWGMFKFTVESIFYFSEGKNVQFYQMKVQSDRTAASGQARLRRCLICILKIENVFVRTWYFFTLKKIGLVFLSLNLFRSQLSPWISSQLEWILRKMKNLCCCWILLKSMRNISNSTALIFSMFLKDLKKDLTQPRFWNPVSQNNSSLIIEN